ncbi:MAG: hypothetical protein J5586_01110 [Clostridia bacterium]|nr:hypothetical protein [Clostridia bacterium]
MKNKAKARPAERAEDNGLRSALLQWMRSEKLFDGAESRAETEYAAMQLEAARRRFGCLREEE